jgi:hypothetical protein
VPDCASGFHGLSCQPLTSRSTARRCDLQVKLQVAWHSGVARNSEVGRTSILAISSTANSRRSRGASAGAEGLAEPTSSCQYCGPRMPRRPLGRAHRTPLVDVWDRRVFALSRSNVTTGRSFCAANSPRTGRIQRAAVRRWRAKAAQKRGWSRRHVLTIGPTAGASGRKPIELLPIQNAAGRLTCWPNMLARLDAVGAARERPGEHADGPPIRRL